MSILVRRQVRLVNLTVTAADGEPAPAVRRSQGRGQKTRRIQSGPGPERHRSTDRRQTARATRMRDHRRRAVVAGALYAHSSFPLQQDGADKTDDGLLVGEDADDVSEAC